VEYTYGRFGSSIGETLGVGISRGNLQGRENDTSELGIELKMLQKIRDIKMAEKI